MTRSRSDNWLRNKTSAMFVMCVLATCIGHYRDADADRPSCAVSAPTASGEITRSIVVDPGRLLLDPTLQVRRSELAAYHELFDGDLVTAGDRFHATVVTSEDAYLYLAFCAGNELAIYPSRHGVRASAGVVKRIPEGSAELVIKGDPGPEVLYLILSRTELSRADPRLAAAIANASSSAKAVDCGASLDADLARRAHPSGSAKRLPISQETQVLRGNSIRKQLAPLSALPAGVPPSRPTASEAAGSSSDRGRSPLADQPIKASRQDEPDFIRNPGSIVWYGPNGPNGPGSTVVADADGIAIVRYRFTHVALASQP